MKKTNVAETDPVTDQSMKSGIFSVRYWTEFMKAVMLMPALGCSMRRSSYGCGCVVCCVWGMDVARCEIVKWGGVVPGMGLGWVYGVGRVCGWMEEVGWGGYGYLGIGGWAGWG
jgi:hypothetical protein